MGRFSNVIRRCFACCSNPIESDEIDTASVYTPSYLYAFDFDQTILRDDSERAISVLLQSEIPDSLLMMYNGENWAEFCEILISYVVMKGITMEEMQESIKNLEPLPGMNQLLYKISEAIKSNTKSKLIVVSGSNDFFITTFFSGLNPPVAYSHILSNHAELSDAVPTTLLFKPYEYQTTCPLCPRFLCKGNALLKYIREQGPFAQVYYVGDGCNDVCPAQKLSTNDILFVREGYELDRVLRFGYYGGKPIVVKARIVYFRSAKQIGRFLKF